MSVLNSPDMWRFGQNVEQAEETVHDVAKRKYFETKASLEEALAREIAAAKKRHAGELTAIGRSYDERFRANAAEYGLR
jgi:hypothetical protein